MLTLLLVTLATWRVTRLLVKDEFPPILMARHRVSERFGVNSWPAYLAECPACMSVWVSGAVTLATDLIVDLPAPFLVWGAGAALALMLATFDRWFGAIAERAELAVRKARIEQGLNPDG